MKKNCCQSPRLRGFGQRPRRYCNAPPTVLVREKWHGIGERPRALRLCDACCGALTLALGKGVLYVAEFGRVTRLVRPLAPQ